MNMLSKNELVTDRRFGSLYDHDPETAEVTKVLRCYHTDESVTYDRFEYCNNGQFIPASEEEIKKWKHNYWDENGNTLE